MRLVPLLIVVAVAAALAGCGGSGSSTSSGTTAPAPAEGPPGSAVASCSGGLRATAVPCSKAESVKGDWDAAPGCQLGAGDSHASCRIQGYLCIAAKVQSGAVVSCAKPGRDVFFRERD